MSISETPMVETIGNCDQSKQGPPYRKKTDECIELKNMKYKSMLLKGNFNVMKDETVTNANIDSILEKEKNQSKSEPWSKVDKTIKINKLREFSEKYGKEQNLSEKEIESLRSFLLSNLDQKKLLRAKDVLYDKTSGEITSIPCLVYISAAKKFTLKRCEKRQSTLKSLAPTKKEATTSHVSSATHTHSPAPETSDTE